MLFQRRQSERMFEAYIRKRFKANSTPFDISATSAFKPTKPLEIHQHPHQHQLQQQQHQPLISPITGQPLSHVPAPLLLSSSTHSTAGNSFRLGRSSTQPRLLQLTVTGTPAPTPANSSHSLHRQHSVSDSINASLSEQLTLSVGNNDTEHIFEMSGIDNDSAIQSLSEDASTATQSSTGVGVARSNSVRARANMFQQLQEQSRSRREAAGREQLPAQSRSFASSQAVTPHHSPPPSATAEAAAASSHNSLNDEPSTPNTTQDTTDADFEPSSLSLAERLAFFSSLCESAACGSGGATAASGSARLFSRPNSSCNSRSPPMDRLARSSTAGSSGNVTPTPMECSPIINDLKQEQPMEPKQPQQQQQQQQQMEPELPPTHNGFHQLTRSATAPTSSTSTVVTTTTTTTPLQNGAPPATRRMRVRTVGKLVLPATFLSDRSKSDNSNSSNSSNISSSHRSSCIGRLQTLEDIHISMGVRTIGKIKSPFIEQQQQQRQQQHQQQQDQSQQQSKAAKMDQQRYSNGASDSGSDSGKENQAANQQKQQQHQQEAQQRQDLRHRHFSHITVQQMPPQQSINRRHTTELSGSSIGTVCMGNNRPKVNERYAKYFGLDDSSNGQLLKTEALNEHVRVPASQMSNNSSSNSNSSNSNTSINKSSSSTSISSNNSNTSMVQRRREMLKRTRAMSMETSMCDGGSISPTAVPSAKRAHSPAHGCGGLNRIASFEDIVVTQDELHAAGHEFKRLCGEILGT
ncbi:serine-rich adhesin for platelets isoform X7 [Drosophila mojavensis]|uniref:serine-rich adhesin for platelets isoform X7 n=1 Tax=Drosophila mojavensis TaxID=7230 RepID=UPI001CD07CC9|nr:serine-rich adhesin for platelets isoform X7 [Drosophila mojavensis]